MGGASRTGKEGDVDTMVEQKFELTFNTDNDAFVEDYAGEVGFILRTLASKIERGSHSGPVLDSNGNTIGNYRLSHQEPQQ